MEKENIWTNMEFVYCPATTKKKLRDAQKEETIRKIEEENRQRNAEITKVLKNLEDFKKKCVTPEIKNDTKIDTGSTQKKQKKAVTKPTTKKTPKGKK